MPEIARALNVDVVVEGSVVRVRVTAQLIEAATDRHSWAESYERDLRDVLDLQSKMARTIANEIKIKLTPSEQDRLARSHQVDPEAHELYLRGRYYQDTSYRNKVTSLYMMAVVYAGLGKKDQALASLQMACNEQSGRLYFLKSDPRFDSLRSDPRFRDVLRCIGLP